MPSAKLAVAPALAALVLSACGTSAKPVAGSAAAAAPNSGHTLIDDPRARHIPCLLAHHLPVIKSGQTELMIGTAAGDPSITFAPTPGSAQEEQITNRVESAEVIGSALLYPHQAPDAELQVIEGCLAQGVSG
jgi:hypothetical protein